MKLEYPLFPPTILQIELTKNCNNACIMCHKGQVPSGQDFDRSDISDIALKQIRPVYRHLRHAMLFGDGEPMMYKNFWDVVAEIRKASPDCVIDFINNGSQMNKLNANKCIQYRVSHLGLSLGGATPETHAKIRVLSDLNQIIANFKYLKQIKAEHNTKEPYITAMIVVMKSNLKELPDFIRMVNDLGFLDIEMQQLFVTHPMVQNEAVSEEETKSVFEECVQVAESLGIGLTCHPKGLVVAHSLSRINKYDVVFKQKSRNIQPKGYCKYQQPWNTVYVLHTGDVVPDCHWWSSNENKELNVCGTLDETTGIIDIWHGEKYEKIRESIEQGTILPQCRGCGLAGGVKDEFRSHLTDHSNPAEGMNQKPIQISIQKRNTLQKLKAESITIEQKDILNQALSKKLF